MCRVGTAHCDSVRRARLVRIQEEIRAASLQFVRKVSGFSKPSKVNEAAFLAAVEQITAASTLLLDSLQTDTEPKNRDEEAAKARLRYVQRFPA